MDNIEDTNEMKHMAEKKSMTPFVLFKNHI